MKPMRFVAAAILIASLTPAAAQAQTLSALHPDAQLPGVTVSVGLGTHFLTEYSSLTGPGTTGPGSTRLYSSLPTIDLSVQVPIRDSLLIEGDVRRVSGTAGFPQFSRIVGGVEYGSLPDTPCSAPQCSAFLGRALHESRDVLNVGANLLFRAGTPRVATFFGGGFGIARTDGRLDVVLTCEAKVPGGCGSRPSEEVLAQHGVIIRPNLRLIYGVDAVIAPRLAAFTAFRWTSLGKTAYDSYDLSGVGITGGVRVALRTKPVAVSAQEVRVTWMDGASRTGRLLSLTDSEVILRENGRDVRIPLTEVRRVEKVSHHALTGALVGTALASAIWIMVATTRDSCADCEDGPLAGDLMTRVLIGGGAGIGALVNVATRGQHLLYLAPRPSSRMKVTPAVSRKRAGVNVGIAW